MTSKYCDTLMAETTGEYQEKGSNFIAYAFPCSEMSWFEQRLRALKMDHSKARHHCYAWRLGESGQHFRAYDDGEPSGTAGLPIYNQLRAFNLSDTAIIVVRYFGGTLLGVSGLIRAYKSAAQKALSAAPTHLIIPQIIFVVKLDYAQINMLMQLIEKYNLQVQDKEMGVCCRYTLSGARDQQEQIRIAILMAEMFLEKTI